MHLADLDLPNQQTWMVSKIHWTLIRKTYELLLNDYKRNAGVNFSFWWQMLAKKIGESFVPYFTCHASTCEKDVEKTCFSFCFATTAGKEKMQCLGHKRFS